MIRHFHSLQKSCKIYNKFTLLNKSAPKRSILLNNQFVDQKSRENTLSTKMLYKPGQKIHGYVVKKVEVIDEIYMTAYLFEHETTKAEHLHLLSTDDNKTFIVMLKTQSQDDTGKPHILEHSVLTGSEKYNVRDPFFSMLNRSVSNFMNAMTAEDWTCYPFSTVNETDYMNLLSVYLDAVFFAKLEHHNFSQEGWRLENSNLKDKDSKLIVKGVVYNEMKGVFNNSQNLLEHYIQTTILGDTAYKFNSGGIPAKVTSLSYNDLLTYYKTYYHPSNAKFYTYGNGDPAEYLKFINDNVMNRYKHVDIDSSIKIQPRWTQEKSIVVDCAYSEEMGEKNNTFTKSYMVCDVVNWKESFYMSVICKLLTEGENSPFYKNLIQSGIGTSYAPMTGYQSTTRNSIFTIGLQDITKEMCCDVEKIVKDTFKQVYNEGFEKEKIEAVLNGIALSQKHKSCKTGLHLGINLLYSWVHEDLDIINSLKYQALMESFKKQAFESDDFIKSRIKKYFMDNKHILTSKLQPSCNYKDNLSKEEEKLTLNLYNNLDQEGKGKIFENANKLQSIINAKTDDSCLPCLQLSDIAPKVDRVDFQSCKIIDTVVQTCVLPTNGIFYFYGLISVDHIPQELKPYLSLFASLFYRIGTKQSDCRQLSQKQDFLSSGFWCHPAIYNDIDTPDVYNSYIMLNSYCTEDNTSKMLDIWTEIFNSCVFSDLVQMKVILNKNMSLFNTTISDSGHVMSMYTASSSNTRSSGLSESLFGISQYKLLKKLVQEEDLSSLAKKMKQIYNLINTRELVKFRCNYSPTFSPSVKPVLTTFINDLNKGIVNNTRVLFDGKMDKRVLFTCPYQVNYSAMSMKGVPFNHPDRPKLDVMSRILTKNYLHKEIREKGGAYGGNARINDVNIELYSYRDPNVDNTMRVYEGCVDYLKNAYITEVDLLEAKLAAFKLIDSPASLCEKGSMFFLKNITYDQIDAYRNLLRNVTVEDVMQVCDKYIKPNGGTCVIGKKGEFCTADWAIESI